MGTHLDFPAHVDPYGLAATDLNLTNFFLGTYVLSVGGRTVIDENLLLQVPLEEYEAILFKSGRDPAVPVAEQPPWPRITLGAVQMLVENELRLVGVDWSSVDQPGDDALPIHRALLDRNIQIMENADLRRVSPDFYTLACFPLRIPGITGCPVRAVLLTQNEQENDAEDRGDVEDGDWEFGDDFEVLDDD
jgi:arylformamidase